MSTPDEKKDVRFVRKSPCEECPFSKKVTPGLGNPDPLVYVGQAYGPCWIPCHLSPGYWDDVLNPAHIQCAGAAIFRANVNVSHLMPKVLHHLPASQSDQCPVFRTPVELVSHHLALHFGELNDRQRTILATQLLEEYPPQFLAQWQQSVAAGKGRIKLVLKDVR